MVIDPSYFVLVDTLQKRDRHESLNAAVIAEILQISPTSEVTFFSRRSHFRNLKKQLEKIGQKDVLRLHYRPIFLLKLIPKERGRLWRFSGVKVLLRCTSWLIRSPFGDDFRSFLIILGSTENDERRLRYLNFHFRAIWYFVHGPIENSVFGIPRYAPAQADLSLARQLVHSFVILINAFKQAKEMNRSIRFLQRLLFKIMKQFRLPQRKRKSLSENASGRAHLASLGVRFLALSGHAIPEITVAVPEIADNLDYIDMPSFMSFTLDEMSEIRFGSGFIGVLGSGSSKALEEILRLSEFEKIAPPIKFQVLGEAPISFWHRSVNYASHLGRASFSQLSDMMQNSSFLIWPYVGGYRVTGSLSLIDGLGSGRIVLAVQSPMTLYLASLYPNQLLIYPNLAELASQLKSFYIEGTFLFDGERIDRFDFSNNVSASERKRGISDLVSPWLVN